MGLFGLMAHNRKLFATGWDFDVLQGASQFLQFSLPKSLSLWEFSLLGSMGLLQILCVSPSVRVFCYLIDYCGK